MLEEILNINLSEIDADIFEKMPQELHGVKGCGIRSGSGHCG